MAVPHSAHRRLRGGAPGPGLRRPAPAALAALAAAGLATAAPVAAAAQEAREDTTVYELGTLEATVARVGLPLSLTPLSVSAVDAGAAVAGSRQLDLHEVLRRVPGVAVDNRHNASLGTRISVRGVGARSAFGVRGVRVLLDGIPLTLPDGQTTLANVDVGTLGRVEVIRGPAAVLYGNAAGGVISLQTEEPSAGEVEARVAAGSYGTGDPTNLRQARLATGGAGRTTSWYTGGSHTRLEGFREHSGVERTQATVRLQLAPDAASVLTWVVHGSAQPRAENPGALPPDSARERPRMAWPTNVAMGAGEESAQAQTGLSYARLLGPVRVEAAAHGVVRSLDNPLPFGRFIRLRRNAGGLRAQATSAAGALTWAAGVEAETQRDDRLERENLDGRIGGETFQDRIDRVAAVAPFALVQAGVAQGLELRAGGRYDRVVFESDDRSGGIEEDRSGRREMDAWSGSLGALVRPGPGTRLWSTVSTWFQTPTTTELINAPPPPGEPCCAPGFNPELDPMTGWGLEAGVRGNHRRVSYELVVFSMRSGNEILPLQVEDGGARDFFQNAGRSIHRGVETAAAVDLARDLALDVAYTFGDYRFHPDDDRPEAGNRIPGVAPHRLHAGATWRPGGATLRSELEWVDAYPVDDENTARNPSYLVVDVRAAQGFDLGGTRLEPFVQVSNLLDTRYNSAVTVNAFGGRSFEPAPGRALLLGLRAAFR